MSLFSIKKDGGPDSTVWAYFLVEWKKLFSVALLRFEDGSRDAYHTHAFNSLSLVLKGDLSEYHVGEPPKGYTSGSVIVTKRSTFHKVVSRGRTWVLTVRGPWVDKWKELTHAGVTTLTHGRKPV